MRACHVIFGNRLQAFSSLRQSVRIHHWIARFGVRFCFIFASGVISWIFVLLSCFDICIRYAWMDPFWPWKGAQIELCLWPRHILRDRLTSDQPTPTGHNSNRFIISVELIFRLFLELCLKCLCCVAFLLPVCDALLLADCLCFLRVSTMLQSITKISPNQ